MENKIASFLGVLKQLTGLSTFTLGKCHELVAAVVVLIYMPKKQSIH